MKMMLGSCRGGVVRLGEPSELVMVGEGIETCLAAMQATGKPAWAALSTSGLRSLDLPHDARDVITQAPGSPPRCCSRGTSAISTATIECTARSALSSASRIWLWLSSVIVLLGAEFNAETEHQTAIDSTEGAPKPLGRRGATMADTIGKAQT